MDQMGSNDGEAPAENGQEQAALWACDMKNSIIITTHNCLYFAVQTTGGILQVILV